MAANEFRTGWSRVASALLGNAIGVHSLPPYTIGLFIVPLQAEFGWSRTAISGGIAILTICTAIAAPLVGITLGRIGVRLLIGSGLAVGALGYFALSIMGPSVDFYWVVMGLMALLGCGCAPVTLSHLVVSSFERNRGGALGISMMGIGLSAALAPVLLGPIVSDYGWRTGYMVLGVAMLCALPLMLCLLSIGAASPRELPRPASASGEIVERDPVFLRLLFAFFAVALAVGGIVVHFVPMLADAGYGVRQAGSMASILGISIMLGRLLTGFLIDRAFAPRVAAVLTFVSSVGFLFLYLGDASWLPFSAVLVGLSLGAELDLIAFMVSRYFASEAFGRSVGILYSSFLVGVALSPLIFAEIRDLMGSYRPGLLWAAGLLFVSGALFLSLPRFPHESEDLAQGLPELGRI